MSWSWEWVVEVRATSSGKEVSLGSGALIAPNRILTACHVVFDNGEVVQRLCVRLEGRSESVPASVVWHSDDDLDVAVLEANLTHDKLGHVLALLSERTIAAGERWEAKGFPEVSEKKPSSEAHKYGDTTLSWDPSEKCLVLKEFATPDSWCGLSGAAVIINGHIVGVVRSYERNHDGRRLRATPIAHFAHVPGFREALGLTEQDDELAKDLTALEADIVRELHVSPRFLQAIADRLECRASAPDVAHALVRTRASDVATLLVDLDKMFAEERHRVRQLLWRTLPLSVDWHAVVLQARRVLAQGGQAIEVPMSTETIAEIILAGTDGRSCEFVMDDRGPRGASRVPLPPEAYSPMFFTSEEGGNRLVDAVVGHWFCEQQPIIKSFPGRKAPKPDDPKVRVWIRKKFADLARKDNPERLPHYVAFSDEEWHETCGTSMDALWTVACEAFKKEIPALRLVRLRGGVDEFEAEADVVLQIEKVMQRRS